MTTERTEINEPLALALARAAFGATARIKKMPDSHTDDSTRYRVAYLQENGTPQVVGFGSTGFAEALQRGLLSERGAQRAMAARDSREGSALYASDKEMLAGVVLFVDGKGHSFEFGPGIKPTWFNPLGDGVIDKASIVASNQHGNHLETEKKAAEVVQLHEMNPGVNVTVNTRVKVAIPKAYVNPNSIRTGLMGWDDDVTPAAVLAAITGEHLLVVGPPGQAKSLFVRRFLANFEGTLFETQLSKYADETALFGAPNLKRLREDGVFEYPKHGIAANDWAFIDEIFDSSDVLMRTLLGILQEKKFTKGGKEESIPLQSCIATANYTRVNEVTSAVVDRFAFAVSSPTLTHAQRARLYSNESFEQVNTPGNVISLEQLAQLRAKAKTVSIPDAIVNSLVSWAGDMGFTPRRERKLASIIRASAALNGRSKVDESDIMAARFCVPISASGKLDDAKKSLQPLKDAILQSLHEGEQLAQLGKLAQLVTVTDMTDPRQVIAGVKATNLIIAQLRAFQCVSEKVNKRREDAVNAHDARTEELRKALDI